MAARRALGLLSSLLLLVEARVEAPPYTKLDKTPAEELAPSISQWAKVVGFTTGWFGEEGGIDDGDPNTVWSTTRIPALIEFDFNRTVRLEEMQFHNDAPNGADQIDVYAYVPKMKPKWVLIASYRLAAGDAEILPVLPTLTVKVRIEFTTYHMGGVSVRDLIFRGRDALDMHEFARPTRTYQVESGVSADAVCFEDFDPHRIMDVDLDHITMETLVRWGNSAPGCMCAKVTYEVPAVTKPPKPNENGTGVSEIYPIPPLPPPYYRPHPYAGLLPPAGEQVGVGSYDALLRPPSLSNFTGSNFTGFWPGASPNFADSPGSLADAGHAPAAPAAGGGAPRAADAGAASSFAEETFISSGSPNGESGDGRLDLTTRTYMSKQTCGALACLSEALTQMKNEEHLPRKAHCFTAVRPLCERLQAEATACNVEVPRMCVGVSTSKCVQVYQALGLEERTAAMIR